MIITCESVLKTLSWRTFAHNFFWSVCVCMLAWSVCGHPPPPLHMNLSWALCSRQLSPLNSPKTKSLKSSNLPLSCVHLIPLFLTLLSLHSALQPGAAACYHAAFIAGSSSLGPSEWDEGGKKSFWKDSVQLSLTFVWRQNVGSFKTCFHSWGLITFAKNPPPTHTQLFRVLKRTPLMSWVTAGIFTVFPVHLACEFKQDWSETLWKIWHPKNLWEKLVTAKMVVQVWFSGEPGFLKSF